MIEKLEKNKNQKNKKHRWYKNTNHLDLIIFVEHCIPRPPRWLGRERICLQCRRHRRCRFDLWVRKIPWRRKWQPTPVFLPEKIPWTEELGGLQSTGSQSIEHEWVTKRTHTYIPKLKNIGMSYFITSCFITLQR